MDVVRPIRLSRALPWRRLAASLAMTTLVGLALALGLVP